MLIVVFYIVLFFATFFFMEFTAWFMHKYVMHGFLWTLHEDHHVGHKGFFEKNDSFFLIFAIPSFLCLFLGPMFQIYFLMPIGFGIAMYGLVYFFVHDIFIHRRFKIFKKTENTYFRAIRKAHKVHHKHLGKEEGECFGMLFVPKKYYQEARKSNN